MPRIKKKSANQKIIADRLKTRKKREDENFRKRENRRYLELRHIRLEGEEIPRKENGPTTQGRAKQQFEVNCTSRLKCVRRKNRRKRKSPVRYTFDELLDYIRLSRVSKPETKGAPEEIVIPVDVLIEEGVIVKEEPASETKEDEVSLIPIPDANEVPNSRQERCELTGQLALGENLKLQMEAKLVALNAEGGLGSCPNGRYECYFCDERLLTRNTLSLHMRTHSVEKYFYECPVCKKKLSSPGGLVRHERLHTRDCPLKCSVCSRSFSVRKELSVHMRTHTGKRPFQCELCEERFKQHAALKTHMWSHFRKKK